jgi:penicillin-binding protein 2
VAVHFLFSSVLQTLEQIAVIRRDPVENRSEDARIIQLRLLIAVSVVVLLVVILVGRFFLLQVADHDRYRTLSMDNRIDLRPLPPVRGMIIDRNGAVLAENQAVYELTVVPEKVPDLDSTLQEIGELVDLGERDVARFQRKVQQRPAFEPRVLKSRLSDEEAARFSVHQYRFPGVMLNASLRRVYPQGPLTAHVVGYVGRISEEETRRIDPAAYRGTLHIGKIGLEAFYETELLGEAGVEQVETDAHGRVVRTISGNPSRAGYNIHLTLDSQLQKVAEEALGDHRGSVVVLEPATGEVLAFVSTPNYDPNLFAHGIDSESYRQLRTSPDKPLINRAFFGRYAPGSTIKPILALAALNHSINPKKKTYCPGWFVLPDNERRFRCWRRKGHGPVDLHDALEQSCDVYFYQLAQTLGIEVLADYMGRFGIGQTTGIDLLSEPSGLLPTPRWKKEARQKVWYPGETIITGIGQGFLLVTPLQLAVATATLANRGRPVRPRLLRGMEDPRTGVMTRPAEERGRSIKIENPAYFEHVVADMIAVVHGSQGTARASGRSSAYRIAGKTGTAQVVGIPPDSEPNPAELPEELRDHALFIAFAPAENPRIALAIIVENGGSGGRTAAPIARKIMDYYFIERLRRAALAGSSDVFG